MSQPTAIHERSNLHPSSEAAASSAHRLGPQPLVRGLIVLLFFLSGAAGLVYEVLWTRSLSLIFGVTVYAGATVMAAFMGGLALGSYVFGRRIDSGHNPLVTYAVLEAGIGAYALLVPMLLDALQPAYSLLRQMDLSYPVLAFARALLAALVLVIPTTLMGGTFPVLTRFFIHTRGEVGRGTGLLYLVNTAGAIAGCLLAGFYLIEHLGMRHTMQVASATNFGVAIVALLVARAVASRRMVSPFDDSAATDDASFATASAARLALVCVGISGFTALAYEVVWMRALLRYLYNSTYAFTTMLATFLAGIALGSALYAALLRRIRRPLLLFAALQLLVGLGFVASSLAFVDLTGTSSKFLSDAVVTSFGDAVRTMFLRSSLILLVPAVFLGATLPLATEVCARGLTTLGATVGGVYAVNTLGAILGSLAAAFVLVPTLGMRGSLVFLVGINLASAGALAIAGLASTLRRVGAVVAVGGALAGAVALMPPWLFERTLIPAGQQALFYREGATDTVAVIQNALGRSILYEDQRGTAGTWTLRWNFFLGHLPMLLHSGTPRTVLHICFGVGNSLSAIATHTSVERIDSVELSPHVIDAAGYFWTNRDVIDDPRVRTIIDDGRNFLLASNETYDVIALEPPEIFSAGVINLYTREFYRDAAARLAPDGVLLQWLPVGEAPLDAERMLFRAFFDVFPDATAWRQLEDGPILLIGTKRPLSIDYRRLKENVAADGVREDMQLIVSDVDHLLSFFAFDAPAFAEFVRGVPPVTDDRTVLDFAMPRYIGSGFGFGSLSPLARENRRAPLDVFHERTRYYFDNRRSIMPYLTNLDGEDPAVIEQRIAGYAKWLPFPARAAGPREIRSRALEPSEQP